MTQDDEQESIGAGTEAGRELDREESQKTEFYYETDEIYDFEDSYSEDQVKNEDRITVEKYLEEKKKICYEVTDYDDAAWHMLRAQINSAVQLQIDLADIDIFAVPDLSYEQREILKYALYDRQGVERDYIKQLATKKYAANELKIMLNDKKLEVKMNETVSTPLQILSDTITAYKKDIDNFKESALEKENEYTAKITELEEELKDSQDRYNKLNKKYEDSVNAAAEKEKHDDQQRLINEKVNQLAAAKFAKLQIEKAAEEERIELERRKWEAETENRKSSCGILGRLRKQKTAEAKPAKIDYKITPLPAGFDLATYMMTAGLGTGQMQVITLAVKANVDDSQIKAMIDQNMPAEQMRQVLAVILARSYKNSNVISEDDIVYDEG